MAPSDSTVIFRVRGSLEFSCWLESSNVLQSQRSISKTFNDLRSKVREESLVFNICNSPVFLWPNQDCQATVGNVSASTPCGDLQKHIEVEDWNGGGRKKRKDKKNVLTVIHLTLMTEVTVPAEENLPAPYLSTEKKRHALNMVLPVDCVISTAADESIGIVCEHLIGALCCQLSDMEKIVSQHMKGTAMPVPQLFHFMLPKPNGLVSVVYPANISDSQLESYRKELHKKYELAEDRPYFRRANAFQFPDQPYKDGYLRNPHEYLNHPNLEGANLYLVQGLYSYHHYMQDRIDDNGWGCAYRSLQTICSWFQQQGYTERAVPTHKEIQQALVDAGDKPAAFVGSCQWIGSIEVQVVLDQLLNVTSKIMFVSQGSELATKGRELANHFETEGTPVMIGGGVLAHTILGVAWSESSGQIRYLILDPHYTGGEDLQTITEKGWCGWKGPDFWDQQAYYNLCLPQRPKMI
ncbi:ufm1-specific protease 2 [Clupea harengus]|uniref:Ufm1-specific protease 2 n=1 Tax=Clupea harengus TaxID=7950 RepID=A0A6P3W711_CLUHA|nr:ufm1-specific protease 2 [Clupea harengus]